MKNKEINKLNNDELKNKVNSIKKDLFNIRFKKINNQVENSAQYSEIKKSIARLYTNIRNSK